MEKIFLTILVYKDNGNSIDKEAGCSFILTFKNFTQEQLRDLFAQTKDRGIVRHFFQEEPPFMIAIGTTTPGIVYKEIGVEREKDQIKGNLIKFSYKEHSFYLEQEKFLDKANFKLLLKLVQDKKA